MDQLQKTGFPILGAVFLALGIFKLVQGESWVVWFILGIVLGGLGLFSRRGAAKSGKSGSPPPQN